ncbi:acetyl-CoA acetyltransferase [Paenibacillus aurantius]|uniref:Acetyl-CoA acetyltransferase n=1 Tax=Paenibacillus aurantius TaxID=2918900 RepID=A0AA96LG74_9BACL|nr:acetyl-CoA acetyltransferase [Paenibacillus aurantius]WNQ10937.1 acetyl-CoA acetyltransferase [Paenibacillus aurantius]
MNPTAYGQPQVLYQADPAVTQTLKSKRDQMYSLGQSCMNRHIRVQTIDGQVYEGTVAGIDGGHLYLEVPTPGARSLYYNNVILPLVLYELLVITLLLL